MLNVVIEYKIALLVAGYENLFGASSFTVVSEKRAIECLNASIDYTARD